MSCERLNIFGLIARKDNPPLEVVSIYVIVHVILKYLFHQWIFMNK